MGFFEIPPVDEEEDELPDYDDPGGRWLHGSLTVEEFVGWSEEAAVAVQRIFALPGTFEVEVVAWLRWPPRDRRRRRGFRPHREIVLADNGPWGYREEDGSLPAEFVRFGVQFPDGGRATNIQLGHRWPDATEPAHGMRAHSGSSSSGEADQRFSVWPLPEAGDIVFVCEWPAHGIAESRLTLDGDQLRAAAARARPVWPDEGPPVGEPGRSSQRILSRRRSARLTATARRSPATAAEGNAATDAEPGQPGPSG
jgi:hypothetical protein